MSILLFPLLVVSKKEMSGRGGEGEEEVSTISLLSEAFRKLGMDAGARGGGDEQLVGSPTLGDWVDVPHPEEEERGAEYSLVADQPIGSSVSLTAQWHIDISRAVSRQLKNDISTFFTIKTRNVSITVFFSCFSFHVFQLFPTYSSSSSSFFLLLFLV